MPSLEKQLFNKASEVVTQNIQALCQQNADLQYLQAFPEVKVVLRSPSTNHDDVAVISGGGAGHEPAHAGYVGVGMLAAAVVGNLFASPSAASILHAVRAVTGSSGCLFIVKNYTGDKLNFGLAAELAKIEGFKVEVVIVGDDCSLPGIGLAGRRGIAGTVFVHKIAGAAAAAGLPLEEVRAVADEAARSTGSMGVATQICRIPGENPPRGLGEDEVEMGLGIHGEPGAYKRSMATADELVKEVADTILKYMKWAEQENEYAILVNNLGTTSALEMGVLLKSAVDYFEARQLKITRVYCGTFMTSTDMSGFSISLLKLKEELMAYLDAPVKVAAWPNVSSAHGSRNAAIPVKASSEESFQRPAVLSDFGRAAESCLLAISASLIDSAAQLDAWDRSAGDGDCGTTVKRGAIAIQSALQENRVPLNDAASLCRCLAGCASAMGGTSGAVYNIFFTAAAGALPKEGSATAQQVSQAVAAGVEKIMFYGGAKAGSRTMLDAILPASETLQKTIDAGESGTAAVKLAAYAAEEGAEATKKMSAGAGRSSYIPESELENVPDPGAKVVSIWMNAVSSRLQI